MARRGFVEPRERIGCHAVFLARNRAKAFFPVRSKYWSEACPYSKLRKQKKSWSFSGIQSFE